MAAAYKIFGFQDHFFPSVQIYAICPPEEKGKLNQADINTGRASSLTQVWTWLSLDVITNSSVVFPPSLCLFSLAE